MLVHFYDVDWDTDGEELENAGLRSDFEDVIFDEDLPEELSSLSGVEYEEALTEFLSDYLTDEYGYCHMGFDYEIL